MSEFKVEVNGKEVELSKLKDYNSSEIHEIGPGTYHLVYNDKSYKCEVQSIDSAKGLVELSLNDVDYTCQIISPVRQTIQSLNLSNRNKAISKNLTAVMPGMVLDVLVSDGQKVNVGEPLMILEAMKMENILKAGFEGVIQKVHCQKEDAVEKGQILIEIA